MGKVVHRQKGVNWKKYKGKTPEGENVLFCGVFGRMKTEASEIDRLVNDGEYRKYKDYVTKGLVVEC